jgi:hypothetical protein
MARTAIEILSPTSKYISNSRDVGIGETSSTNSLNSYVISPVAETTIITRYASFLVLTIRWAKRFTLATFEMEQPPYFWTINDIL